MNLKLTLKRWHVPQYLVGKLLKLSGVKGFTGLGHYSVGDVKARENPPLFGVSLKEDNPLCP